ncbi:hypothetical protein KJ742_07120 [Patescibacteria group bacterium]|nr:hypothetical protein [Patescibacteria group bacterium]
MKTKAKLAISIILIYSIFLNFLALGMFGSHDIFPISQFLINPITSPFLGNLIVIKGGIVQSILAISTFIPYFWPLIAYIIIRTRENITSKIVLTGTYVIIIAEILWWINNYERNILGYFEDIFSINIVVIWTVVFILGQIGIISLFFPKIWKKSGAIINSFFKKHQAITKINYILKPLYLYLLLSAIFFLFLNIFFQSIYIYILFFIILPIILLITIIKRKRICFKSGSYDMTFKILLIASILSISIFAFIYNIYIGFFYEFREVIFKIAIPIVSLSIAIGLLGVVVDFIWNKLKKS